MYVETSDNLYDVEWKGIEFPKTDVGWKLLLKVCVMSYGY